VASNSIHRTALIGPDVRMGEGNTVGAFVVIEGSVTIGDQNWIGTGAVLGAPPEVRSHDRTEAQQDIGARLRIGHHNVIREYVQIHRGWQGTTSIADNAFVMNQSYIAHDCVIESGVTLASSVLLAGHVHIGASANLGLGAMVHQRKRIGAGTIIGMGSVVTRDVPPFAKAYGNPARMHGVNRIGMERSGISNELLLMVERVYSAADADWDLTVFSKIPALADAFRPWYTP